MRKTPFENYVLAEPYGISGGIVVMWDPTFINFQLIGKDLHAIHGVVEKDNPIYQRLDRAWVNMHWLNLFPNTTVHTLPRESSDHNPIKLITEQESNQNVFNKKPFKLEPLWYAEPGFANMINAELSMDGSELVSKLSNISDTMESWVKNNIGNIFHKRKKLSARLSGTQKALETRPTKVNIPSCQDHHYRSDICIDHATNVEEIGKAVFDPGPLKAPGIDGLHAYFYQQHWGNLWQDLYNYKIVSKILVNRIRPHLKDIISPNQNSFLPGRGCEVNYIAASEILHSMKSRKGKNGWFAFKIDLEKAYDRLEWNFIRFCLARKGFDKNSTDLILNCVASPSTSVIINGKPSPTFKTSRGIRQGDPISPYIFIICMEYLSDLITEAASEGKWKPFCLRKNGIPITHLMFADDLLLFGDTSPSTLNSLKEVLENFWECSGQKMNNSKSRIYFSKYTSQHQKDLFCTSLHKIKSKLASWKAKCLSKAGRLVLIKSTLSSIASYSMQALYLPQKTLQEIDQTCANFLWDSNSQSKKTHLVAWLKACRDPKLGGLSVRSAILLNQAQMVKLCWKLHTGNNLGTRLVKDKYITNRVNPTRFSKGSHIWQNVGKGWDLFNRLTAWCIGDGTHINFWYDNWTGKGRLRDLIHAPLNREEENRRVESVMRNGHWNLNILPFILPTNIITWIHAIPIPLYGEDAPYCGLSKGPKFNLKSAYNEVWNSKFPVVNPNDKWSCVWKARCPPKIQFFLWLTIWGRLPTASHLANRHVIPNGNCQFCPHTQEDIAHLFIHCPRAIEFWNNIEFTDKFKHLYNDVEKWILENLNCKEPSNQDIPNQTIFAFCLWRLWNRRNLWVFQKENKHIVTWCKQTIWLANEFENRDNLLITQGKPVQIENPTLTKFIVKCDASFCTSTLLASYEIVCRNEDHKFLAGIAGTFTTVTPTLAEAQTILMATSWTIAKGWQDTTIISDCKEAGIAKKPKAPMVEVQKKATTRGGGLHRKKSQEPAESVGSVH
ncbi:uncharacterized protein [Spinacia oleracea]|uniref:Reverse transcriptase domain-containing protein n=1 Tax=Spinacia oleracea TaxID=3562 RepID=A0ABM3R8Z2_SPIOL|nr:uncharacterized protein LOC130467559 [Spinacia oleracea]